MTLNPNQLQFFKENYASVLVDKIVEGMNGMTEDEVYDIIVEVYDKDTASDQYHIAKLYQ